MRIAVVGDVVVDHHVYEGERSNPAATESRGVSVKRELGGAKALANLINEMCTTTNVHLKQARKEADEKYQEQLREYEASSDPEKQEPTKPDEVPTSPLESCEVSFGLEVPKLDSHPCGHHGLAVFRPYPESHRVTHRHFWRASTLLGYGHDNPEPAETDAKNVDEHCRAYQLQPDTDDPGDVLVLDDAAFKFRTQSKCWLLDCERKPSWIVIKQTAPVCCGELWNRLEPHRDKLVVVVSVTELRDELARISKGLSWERTIEDLASALTNDPILQHLNACRHVVIAFSADGALWLDNGPTKDSPPKAHLVYDPASIEGQWAEQSDGEVFGFMSCMVAAVTRALVYELDLKSETTQTHEQTAVGTDERATDFIAAMRSGLAAMRDLRRKGHGRVCEVPPNGYPLKRLANVLYSPADYSVGERYSACPVPWQKLLSAKSDACSAWSIAVQAQLPDKGGDFVTMPMSGLAQEVVRRGRRVLCSLPHATFGGLFTIDRSEIETLRTLRRLLKNYKQEKQASKPLSIGVFGPPGAGKSFGVKQIAKEIFGKDAWLEFNLSQFSQGDLVGALHQVRDKVLEIGIPVVFWDEFDSKNYSWLQYLLAPMQDGRFQDVQINHPIGSCVFIFAGATSSTFQDFGPPQPDPVINSGDNQKQRGEQHQRYEAYKLVKGPDFMSRLDGYYNVLGPNPRTLADGIPDPDDRCAPIRRSLLLRQFLCGQASDFLDIDAGLLRALLEVRKYKNGARSLQKLSQSLKPKKPCGPVRRSDLCSPTQLAMFVDDQDQSAAPVARPPGPEETLSLFMARCRDDEPFLAEEKTEPLAKAIHGSFLDLADKDSEVSIEDYIDQNYEAQKEDVKEANRGAARRIPVVLAVAGLKLEPVDASQTYPDDYDSQAKSHIEHHIEIMAELEHDLWCKERRKAGWHPGKPRDNKRRIHPLLIPYADLGDKDKEKDRNQVRNYPKFVAKVGYRIVFAGTQG